MVDASYIESIESISGQQRPSLDQQVINKYINKYPCFHGIHLLKGLHLKHTDEKAYEEALPNIAVHVNDRTVLYDLVHTALGKSSNKSVVPKKDTIAVKDEPIPTEEEIVIKGGSEDLKSLVQAIRSNRKSQETKASKKRRPKNIESAVNKNKSISKKKTLKVEQKEEGKSKKKINTKIPGSFTDWLKNKKPVEVKTETQVPIDPVASHEAELILEAKRSPSKLEDFLVDQIQRKQHKKVVSSQDGINAISETYAKILATQGKIEDAISIYKELSIKYPKKSSNFARQIEKLKSS